MIGASMSEPFGPQAESELLAQTEMVFEPKDLDLLSFAVSRVPELCIGAWAAKRRRELGLKYPFEDPDDLIKLLAGKDFVGSGYRIRPKDVTRYFPAVFFPVRSDRDLIRKVRISLVRADSEYTLLKSQEFGSGFILKDGKQ
jgi:hypothetical protein